MIKTPKNAKQFLCEVCNFICSKKCDYIRHITTAKHLNRTNQHKLEQPHANDFVCECGKKYVAKSGLWYHKKKCTFLLENSQEVVPPQALVPPQEGDKRDDMIDKLVNSTTEMKEMMLMMMKSQMHSQESLKETLQETQRQNQETQRQNQETLQETQRQNQEIINKIIKIINKIIKIIKLKKLKKLKYPLLENSI
jgi:hypothetical protein